MYSFYICRTIHIPLIKQFRQNTTFYIHFYIYHGVDPFQDRTQIYRSRLVSKYLIPQQNFINLLQEKLPSSLTGINEEEQVSFDYFVFKIEILFSRKNLSIALRMYRLLMY